MCSFRCANPHGSFSLCFFFSSSCCFLRLNFSLVGLKSGNFAFLIQSDATRPFQDAHFPINKYTKTFSHVSRSHVDGTSKQNNHGDKVFLLPLLQEVHEGWNYTHFIVDIPELSWRESGQVDWNLFKVIVSWQMERTWRKTASNASSSALSTSCMLVHLCQCC